MDIASTRSKNGVLIRLTKERWKHIVLMHPNLYGRHAQVINSVKAPDYILRGKAGELLAVLMLSMRRYLVVVYKEERNDGFIITSYETNDTKWLFKKELIWNRPS